MTDTANTASSAAFQGRLETQLAELEARFSHLERDLDEPLNADSSEQAVELEDDQSLEDFRQITDTDFGNISAK